MQKKYDKALGVSELLEIKKKLNLPYDVIIENEINKKSLPDEAIILIVRKNEYSGHWVCIKKIANKSYFYYDSLGVIIDECLNVFLDEYEFFYNEERQQKSGSYWCGHYCVNFLNYINKIDNPSIKQYLEKFIDKAYDRNDKITKDEFIKIMKCL